MPHYKDLDGKFHFLDDAAHEYMLPAGCVQINDEEAAAAREKPLAERQAAALERIKQERDKRTKRGGYLAGGFWFHSDEFSRIQQIALVQMGGSIPSGLMWKTLSGDFVQMTQSLALQIFSAAAANDKAIFERAEIHRAAMMQAANPDEYDFSTGWPLAFWEA